MYTYSDISVGITPWETLLCNNCIHISQLWLVWVKDFLTFLEEKMNIQLKVQNNNFHLVLMIQKMKCIYSHTSSAKEFSDGVIIKKRFLKTKKAYHLYVREGGEVGKGKG